MRTPIVLGILTLCVSRLAGAEGPGNADPPAGLGAMAPNLTTTPDAILLSWIEAAGAADDEKRRLRWSVFSRDTWSPAQTIAERDDFFANWADVPSVTRGGDGALYAHWLQKSGPGTYAYDVIVARSSDDGATWRTLGAAHDDGTETEHGFVSMVPDRGGVRAFWLDGREMATGAHGHGHGNGNMAVRTALVGSTIGPSVVLDARVCECCGTSATLTDAGPILVYRDRDADEVRDIAIVRAADAAWSAPITVHHDGWAIAGCPVNGPAIDARGNDVVAAWYTGANGHGAVRAAFSRDAGAGFGPPVTIDGTRPLGRVDACLLGPDDAVVTWLTDRDGVGTVMACRVTPHGTGPAMPVTVTSLARSSGFPALAVADGQVLVVWVEDAEVTRLRGRRFPLAALARPGAAVKPRGS